MISVFYKLVIAVLLFLSITVNGLFGETSFRLAFQLPLNHHLSENIIHFKSEVEARSNGRIKVELRDYGTFLELKKKLITKETESKKTEYFKDAEIADAVSMGLVEAGLVSLARYEKVEPLVDIFYQPFLFNTDRKVRSAVSINSPVRGAIDASIEKNGSKVLWWQSYGNVIMVTNGDAIQNPEDVNNKRVRVFSKTLGNMVLASNGVPKAISNSNQKFSYKHEKVDVGMTTVLEISRQKIWEVMDTISLTNNASVQFVTVVNASWWRNINQFDKKILLEAARNAEKRAEVSFKILESNSYKEVLENGMRMVVVSDDSRDYWKQKSEPVYKKFLDLTGEKGMELFLLVNNF